MNISIFNRSIFIITLLFSFTSFGAIGKIQLDDKNVPVLYIDVPCYRHSVAWRLEDFPQIPMIDLIKNVQEALASFSMKQEQNDQQACGGLTYGFKAEKWQITLHEKPLALFTLEDIKKLLITPEIILQIDVFYDDPIY